MAISIKKTSILTLLATSLSALLLSACQSTDIKIGDINVGHLVHHGLEAVNARAIDEEQEIQIGLNMSAVLLGARPLVEQNNINHYVNQVGMWLASHSDRPDLPWTFGVINSESINAFAAPGGYIFITSGMIAQLDNEAQLAAVLAHEIIHVTEQHHLQAIQEGTLRVALTESLFVTTQVYQQNTSASSKQVAYSEWAKTATDTAQYLYVKGLDRGDEYIADEYGIRLLAKAGYDPYAFVDNLQLLSSISPDDTALALMYKTHPTPGQRLAEIAGHLDNLPVTDGLLLTDRFVKVMR
ncbi:M48 family metalloprotease [Colwellia sp. D2M02]|uniref:M48 family metalloprotease n=1 Tax=Colwellia sp. D2M02 TaxID=2841562 RepID=UPI001C085174|nr:M48 family metalloprotease [Colwellia sp. D2M02]MBU2895081.1 M48 family metalloprotease [Colwellia sp. D2M02]